MSCTRHLRREFPLVFLSLALMALGGTSREAGAADGKPSTPAVYFQHIGDSDKPIFPIVFSSVEVPKAERDLVLGDESRFARVVLLPKSKYSVFAKAVAGRLTAADRSDAVGFGTFRVTLVSASGPMSATLVAERVAPLLQQARAMIAPADREAIAPISALQRRLGGGETR